MLQSSSSEKKLMKPLKNCFIGLNLHKKGVIMGHVRNEKHFFGRNNYSRSSAFRHGCSNHSNLEMEAKYLTKKLVILEFKHLQNEKWLKQAVKGARTKKSYRTY